MININEFILEQIKKDYQKQVKSGCFSGSFEEYRQEYLNVEGE